MTVEVAIDVLQARARQRVLDNIRVAAPCPADWSDMVGDDRVRHCSECKLDVYNLSGMTREEAEALITGRIGRLCVTFYRRSDGTVITTDCPVGSSRLQRRRLVAATAAGGLAAGALALWATVPPEPEPLERQPQVTFCPLLTAGPADSDYHTPSKLMVPAGEAQPTTEPATETIVPDAETLNAMAKQGIIELRGTWQLCLGEDGAVTSATKLESTGIERYDGLIAGTVKTWHFPRYAGGTCFELTFVYTTPPS